MEYLGAGIVTQQIKLQFAMPTSHIEVATQWSVAPLRYTAPC